MKDGFCEVIPAGDMNSVRHHFDPDQVTRDVFFFFFTNFMHQSIEKMIFVDGEICRL